MVALSFMKLSMMALTALPRDPCVTGGKEARVSSTSELHAVLADRSILCIKLDPVHFIVNTSTRISVGGGYGYNTALHVTRSVSLTSDGDEYAVLDAQALAHEQRTVLTVDESIVVFIRRINITGGQGIGGTGAAGGVQFGLGSGGGILTMADVHVYDNGRVNAPAIQYSDWSSLTPGELVMDRCTVHDNPGPGLRVSGIFHAKISRSAIFNNAGAGGRIEMATVVMHDTSIYDNAKAGLDVDRTAFSTATGCSIHGNGNAVSAGGGVRVGEVLFATGSGGMVLFDNTQISQNRAPPGGGAAFFSHETSRASYALPVPLGRFIPGSPIIFRCDNNSVCDYRRFHGRLFANLSISVEEDVPSDCLLGHWCDGTRMRECPAGKLGNLRALNSSRCAGDCWEGFYCPKGSVAPTACADGTYGNRTGLRSQSDCADCLPGKWCASGTMHDCPNGTFSSRPNAATPRTCRACSDTDVHSTTRAAGSSSAEDCVCEVGFFHDLETDAPQSCLACTHEFGFDCPSYGSNTLTAHVKPGFWRPSVFAVRAKQCPHAEACRGGVTVAGLHVNGSSECASGFAGPYCAACEEMRHYISSTVIGGRHSLACKPCEVAYFGYLWLVCSLLGLLVALFILCTALSFSSAAIAPRHHSAARRIFQAMAASPGSMKMLYTRVSTSQVVVKVRNAAVANSLPTKGKICLGFALVMAQLSTVYEVRYTRETAHASFVISTCFGWMEDIFGWLPSLHLSCLGISSIWDKLLLYTILPLVVIAIACGGAWTVHRSLVPALPFVLFWTYLVFPSVSSKGFRALSACDCFPEIVGRKNATCLLRADYSVLCDVRVVGERWTAHAPSALWYFALLGPVCLYGAGVPLLYALLLASCRKRILNEEPSPLSCALGFLHGTLRSDAIWPCPWPLIEASRALLLTGFASFIEPGTVTQLICGVAVAFSYTVLHTWTMPYHSAANNLLGMATNFAITLYMLALLGVQANSSGLDPSVNSSLLASALLASAFFVFVPLLLTGALTLRQSARPSKCDADDSDSCVTAPIIAPQHHRPAFSVNHAAADRDLSPDELASASFRPQSD